ncbi:hypothetical protein SAMN05421752_103147 [Natronorubrum thiooxidans]|uniref:Uncharacterized protein n=1 Tax=Natronorubrum thiooxidans TaxID=308853 RepID=A0A1N7E2N9_9EURY|nr:hypothetical protein SAMN05421752_103147 [Natronorubrum thiooxidans]
MEIRPFWPLSSRHGTLEATAANRLADDVLLSVGIGAMLAGTTWYNDRRCARLAYHESDKTIPRDGTDYCRVSLERCGAWRTCRMPMTNVTNNSAATAT